jgi:hypothetical protein
LLVRDSTTSKYDKIKYKVMYRDHNAGRGYNVKIDNISSGRVEEVKYQGTTLTNQNFIHEEIKIRLKSGNACCRSVQKKLLSSSLLSNNLNIMIYRALILPAVLYGLKRSRLH